jgi:hypothetical protein
MAGVLKYRIFSTPPNSVATAVPPIDDRLILPPGSWAGGVPAQASRY